MLRSVASLEDILKAIQYPSREKVWMQLQSLGAEHEQDWPGYTFLRRRLPENVEYLVDADLIFLRKKSEASKQIAPEDVRKLYTMVKSLCGKARIIHAKVLFQGTEVFNGRFQKLAEVLSGVAKGADVVILTGVYTVESQRGWAVPVDFTLQAGAPFVKKAEKLRRATAKLEEGNFGKAAGRVRSLLSHGDKASFTREWTSAVGALSFLQRQLELVHFLENESEKEAYRQRLCLPENTQQAFWEDVVRDELQCRARELLWRFRTRVSLVLRQSIEATCGPPAPAALASAQPPAGPSATASADQQAAGAQSVRGAKRKACFAALERGSEVGVKCDDGCWYGATVLRLKREEAADNALQVKVRYHGCGKEDDEWLSELSGKAVRRLKTKPTQVDTSEENQLCPVVRPAYFTAAVRCARSAALLLDKAAQKSQALEVASKSPLLLGVRHANDQFGAFLRPACEHFLFANMLLVASLAPGVLAGSLSRDWCPLLHGLLSLNLKILSLNLLASDNQQEPARGGGLLVQRGTSACLPRQKLWLRLCRLYCTSHDLALELTEQFLRRAAETCDAARQLSWESLKGCIAGTPES
eukprot:s683_g29.t1